MTVLASVAPTLDRVFIFVSDTIWIHSLHSSVG